MTTIRFENITKSFGGHEVIKPLDLTVKDGEFFTFVGPSGCGKSTILNLVAGLEEPSTGTLLFDDRPVNRLSPRERDIALVFQSYALYPHMTVFENIAFPLRMRKEQKNTIRSEVERVAGLLGIAELLEKRPRQLSGGQRQRVALGRAIIRRPRVFLMDEPLSNLDARLRLETRGELKRLHRDLGITTVYVTHDQSEAMSLSDRLAVLERGAVQQCDSPLEVYRRPANTFVAGFIGIPAMNILPGRVTGRAPLRVELLGTVIELSGEVPGKEVLVGIRPEDLVARRLREERKTALEVLASEPAGPVTWLELAYDGLKIRATARPEEELRPGETCFLSLPGERIALFDKSTGKLI
jgi:multiple sugar transport system ATP-binding protein